MKINKNGFTLVELIAVIVVLSFIMILMMPSLFNLNNSNKEKQYTAYEDMMIEYTKVYPNYKTKEFICLSELNIEPINNLDCSGYVDISTMTAYLSCQKNEEIIYETDGYSANKSC